MLSKIKYDLIAATENNDIKLVKDLVNKVNIDYRDKDMKTALFYSAVNGNIEICQLLLEKGANMYIKDDRGLMAIHYAILHDNKSIIKLFIDNNFNVPISTLKDDLKNTTLDDKRYFLRLIKKFF